MNVPARTIIALCVSVISIIVMLSKCHNQQIKKYQLEHNWTPELEAQMRDVFYTQISNTKAMLNDSAKTAFANCCVAKVKELFPHGLSGIEMISTNDSLKAAVMKIGADCSGTLTANTFVWQPDVVQQLKLQFFSYPEIKLLPVAARSEYVDCLAYQVESKFPNGLGAVSADSMKKVIEQARNHCSKLIVKKYKMLKKNTSIAR